MKVVCVGWVITTFHVVSVGLVVVVVVVILLPVSRAGSDDLSSRDSSRLVLLDSNSSGILGKILLFLFFFSPSIDVIQSYGGDRFS